VTLKKERSQGFK